MQNSHRKLVCVGLHLDFWPNVKDDVQRALDDRTTLEHIYQKLVEKKMQLWSIHDGNIKAVMTTEIAIYDTYKAVRVVTLTGDCMDEWLDLLIDTITRWAKENGCDSFEFCGRTGWEKVLSKKGFGNKQIVMNKTI